ncbi:V-type ATPase subunit [Sneathia sanguinegens]|uniref:V-type ATPase subunit n=1 Tax=Sneathia sanguinegens TaxID=40543 RepID=UPI00280540BA|nr:V-type ATPase subunit [Sneathia sanguinegens]MDU7497346.1 V-type ATPase subunit [Sneathia sanguinegens]
MINRMEYVQTAAIVKVQEKKLLSKSKLNRMIESENISEIYKILSETAYSKAMINTNSEHDFEDILAKELEKVYAFSRELAKDAQDCVTILQLRYIYQNLKMKLKSYIKEGKNQEIDEEYMADYMEALKEYEKNKDVQSAVILLDRLYFSRLKKLCSKIGLEILDKYYNLAIKSYNLLTFLRLKNQKRSYKYAEACIIDDEELLRIYEGDSNYIQTLEKYFDNKKLWSAYSKTKKISSIEKELENMLVNLMKEYKNVNYGIEPIITYILAKEYEIKALRLIITAKINKIPNNIIKERMREIYV